MVVAGTGIGPRVERLLVPLRDMFAAIFFFWFGLTIAPSDMGAIAPAGRGRGRRHARLQRHRRRRRRADLRLRPRARPSNTALMLVSRGEFELILASLAVAAGLDSRVAPFAALYVLVLSILSPLFSARSEVLARRLPDRLFAPQPAREAAAELPESEPIIEVGVIRRLGAETVEHPVRRGDAVVGAHVRDLGLPREALVSVIVRGDEAIAPRGSTRIRAGDRLHILVRREAARRRSRRCRSAGAAGRSAPPPRPRRRLRGSSPIFTVRPVRRRRDGRRPRRARARARPARRRAAARPPRPPGSPGRARGRPLRRHRPADRRRLARRRDDLRATARRSAGPDDRAWLQTVVGALAIDIFDRAPVQGPRPRRPAPPSEPASDAVLSSGGI